MSADPSFDFPTDIIDGRKQQQRNDVRADGCARTAKQQLLCNRDMVFSVQSLPRYKQDELVRGVSQAVG